MAKMKEYPVRFSPRGLSDAWDATDTFQGACRALSNLILDQTNPELVVARPGVGTSLIDLGTTTLSGSTSISVQTAIGSLVYGMVTCTLYGAFDVPFCYDIDADALIVMTGVTPANIPVSQSTSGDWIPPTMAVVGDQIVITHPGFDGGSASGAFTGALDGSTLTISAAAGVIVLGSNIAGTSVPPNTVINGFISGTFGGIGVYTVNNTVGAPITAEAMTASSSNFFGVINISNPAAPYWYATNTGIFPLPSVPNAVSNFNNRAYFACANLAYYSDVLIPTQATNAGQALTVGDTTAITAFAGLPIQTTAAGVVAALVVFKPFQIWQITGDAAITGSLSQNYLSLTVGCLAARSVVQTPVGTIFIGIDGPYYVSPSGLVLPLTKDPNSLMADIQKPFQNVRNPSRAGAAFSGSVYRICLDTIVDGRQVTNDYWFDITRRRWSGPHSFPYDCASQVDNYFVISSRKKGANLWRSQYLPQLNSVYNDNGAALSSRMQSIMLPKTPNINEKQVIETTIELATGASGLTYNLNATDDHGQVIGTASIAIVNPYPTWGSGITWGGGTVWTNSDAQPYTYTVPWTAPLVFKKLAYEVTAVSSAKLAIGTIFSKYRDCGYTNVIPPWSYVAPP